MEPSAEMDAFKLRGSVGSVLPKALHLNGALGQPGADQYPSNAVHSHRYTLLNFLPLQVYEQLNPLRKFANFYFLCVGCLQAVPSISVTGGLPVTFGPLMFVLGVDALTKLYEDWQRRRSDALTNSEPTRVLNHATGAFDTRPWDEIKTGDIVAVRNREIFPADLLLLGAAGGAHGGQVAGHCWVSTKSLDGETDTKLREAPKVTTAHLADGPDAHALLLALRGTLRCEPPNGNCNDFAGLLHVAPAEGAAEGAGVIVAPITENNMLLRGCQLRNTAEVYALVVSTGAHTKAQYGAASGGGASLSSTAEKVGAMTPRMNRDILGICAMLAALSVLGVVLHRAWCGAIEARGLDLWYLAHQPLALCENAGELLGSYFLLSYTFIPVSLYVSVNLVYTATAFLMAQDLRMYDAHLDQPAEVRAMSLCDELGRISHVLSDKTGTLTANHMRLRRLTLGHAIFGASDGAAAGSGAPSPASSRASADGAFAPLASPRARASRAAGGACAPHASSASRGAVAELPPGTQLQPLGSPHARPLPAHYGCKAATAPFVRYAERDGAVEAGESLYGALDDGSAKGVSTRAELQLLMAHLAVNHSVLYEEVGAGTELSASSPDELALVAAAEHFGYEFAARDLGAGCVLVRNKREGATAPAHAVRILAVFPYVSSRKRMTTLVRLPQALCPPGAPPSGRAYAFTKGADNVLLERLAPPSASAEAANANSAERVAALRQTLGGWADEALRTLVFGARAVPDAELEPWLRRYALALEDPRERAAQKDGRPNRIDALQAEIEVDLLLQGGSAVEDELQDGVPDALRDLGRAGVKVWMLTGDKVGTAKNIAAACSLLPSPAAAPPHHDHRPVATGASLSAPAASPPPPPGGDARAARAGSVLELTAETVHGLEGVPATDLAAVAREAAAHYAAISAASKGRRQPWRLGAQAAPAQPDMFRALEAKHPALRTLTHEMVKAARAVREAYGEAIDVSRGALSPRPSADDGAASSFGFARGGGGGGGDGGAELHLVVDEKAIDWLLAVVPAEFAAVALRAKAVVACRCRQEQKAQMVNVVVQQGRGARVLAIGDGANDVAMIRAAHVGVGIAGKEGMQAVQNADFAIGQFRFLRRLLLVHGRHNYRRMAVLVCYMFYKNVIDRFAQFVYTAESGWSGQKYYSEVATQLFNVIYTSLPIILVAVTDADVPRYVAERVPALYRAGVRQAVYTHALFWSWVAEALLVGGLLYMASKEVFAAQFARGLSSPSVLSLGIICQSTIVTVCTLRLALEVHAWKWPDAFVFALSLGAWVLSMLVFSSVYFNFWSEWWGFVNELLFTAPFWLFSFWSITIGLLPKLCREVVGWLWPDTSRRTRFLRMRRTQRTASEHTRMLLTGKPRDSNWQQGDAELGHVPSPPRTPSMLVDALDHGFAFSHNDPAGSVIAAVLQSPRDLGSEGSSAITVAAESPREDA